MAPPRIAPPSRESNGGFCHNLSQLESGSTNRWGKEVTNHLGSARESRRVQMKYLVTSGGKKKREGRGGDLVFIGNRSTNGIKRGAGCHWTQHARHPKHETKFRNKDQKGIYFPNIQLFSAVLSPDVFYGWFFFVGASGHMQNFYYPEKSTS